MAALEAHAHAVQSPCVRLCGIDEATGFCIGCYRTLDEVVAWQQLTQTQQLQVVAQCDTRKAKYADDEN